MGRHPKGGSNGGLLIRQ